MVAEIKTVSLGIIALNEEKYLPTLLENVKRQTYRKKNIELILVDSFSTDTTKQIMLAFQAKYRADYLDIKVLDNPKKNQPAGWNVVIQHFTCDALLRIDAHAQLPDNFIAENIACLNTGEAVCGGPRTNIIDSSSLWKQSLLHVEQSLFGSGIAAYRRKDDRQKKYVSSVFHGAYRREVIEKVGFFNESLLRTEDNEYHYRIRQEGYQICYVNTIHSEYQTRNSLLKMIEQKYLNGLWIGKTVAVCPQCLSLFHFVPLAFVLALFVGLLLSLAHLFWALEFILGVYFVAMGISMVFSLVRTKNIYDICIPILCFVIHLAYGLGTLKGIVSGLKIWRSV